MPLLLAALVEIEESGIANTAELTSAVAKSNMFVNKADELKYFYLEHAKTGASSQETTMATGILPHNNRRQTQLHGRRLSNNQEADF